MNSHADEWAHPRRQIIDAVTQINRDMQSAEPLGKAKRSQLHTQRRQLESQYESLLPAVELSRCPFCDQPVVYKFDNLGPDGLWWRFDEAVRSNRSPNCDHFLMMDGAIALQEPIENADTPVRLGPDVPFVIPRILQHDSVQAVVSSVPIGRHTGFPICYFGDPYPIGLQLANDWASRMHLVFAGDTNAWGERIYQSGSVFVIEFEMDFDLRPWMDRGKLAWIEPDDRGLRLRSQPEGCPYLDLPGQRMIQFTQDGEVWLSS